VRFAPASLALFLICATVGCGGGNGPAKQSPPKQTYSRARTEKCLNGAGVKAISVKDPALEGSLGDLQVTFGYGTGEIDMAFGRNAAEARTIENRGIALTARHLKLDRATILSDVRLKSNVFYYSPEGPVTEIQNTKITSCLR
jgi:hypothetical protein